MRLTYKTVLDQDGRLFDREIVHVKPCCDGQIEQGWQVGGGIGGEDLYACYDGGEFFVSPVNYCWLCGAKTELVETARVQRVPRVKVETRRRTVYDEVPYPDA